LETTNIKESKMRKEKEKKLLGHIDVDAGLVYIGDPCYLYGGDDFIDGGNLPPRWDQVCASLGDKYPVNHSVPHAHGRNGQGIIASTCWGDGTYPVYAELNSEGRFGRIIIDFDEEE
jgi:hypothetical protein